MPLYEYQCEKCGLVFEARQKFSDPPLTECRDCGGAVTKLISQGGFALKGGAGTIRAIPPRRRRLVPPHRAEVAVVVLKLLDQAVSALGGIDEFNNVLM